MVRAAAGDQGACRRLVDHCLPRAHALARRMLGSSAAADDVAQEAFVRLWRAAPGWRPDGRASTWLHRVVHNLCIDQLRRRNRDGGEVDPDVPDGGPDPAARHQQRQVAVVVAAAVDALPERQRTALTLVHHEGLAAAEAADIMGVTIEALESLLGRARRTLRTRLAGSRQDLLGDV